jgi:folate-binding Fe-S cluster repair protein YgfZ
MSDLAFIQYQLNGVDAQKFLQGQVTLHVERLPEQTPRYTAICDLKGRIQFGLWLTKLDAEHFEIVVTQDQSEEFAKHIKKYGAFSKMTLSTVGEVFLPSLRPVQVFLHNLQISQPGNNKRLHKDKPIFAKPLHISFNRKSYVCINVKASIMTRVVI